MPLARPTPGTLSGSSLRNWTPTPGLGWSLVGREALRQRPRGKASASTRITPNFAPTRSLTRSRLAGTSRRTLTVPIPRSTPRSPWLAGSFAPRPDTEQRPRAKLPASTAHRGCSRPQPSRHVSRQHPVAPRDVGIPRPDSQEKGARRPDRDPRSGNGGRPSRPPPRSLGAGFSAPRPPGRSPRCRRPRRRRRHRQRRSGHSTRVRWP